MKGLIFLAFCWSVFSAETDSFTYRYQKLEDSAPYINYFVNREMNHALVKLNKKKHRCQEEKLYKAIMKKFNRPLESKAEHELNFSPMVDRHWSRKGNVYSHFTLFGRRGTFLILTRLSPSINIDGHYVGTDKISHFFSLGRLYFKRAVLKGKGLAGAISYGNFTEKTFLGSLASGIYSYADLLANYQGMLFWNDIYRSADPYVVCRAGKFVKVRDFDISRYVDDGYDEGINCNQFRSRGLEEAFNERIVELEELTGFPMSCPIKPESCPLLVKKYGKLAPELISPACLAI